MDDDELEFRAEPIRSIAVRVNCPFCPELFPVKLCVVPALDVITVTNLQDHLNSAHPEKMDLIRAEVREEVGA